MTAAETYLFVLLVLMALLSLSCLIWSLFRIHKHGILAAIKPVVYSGICFVIAKILSIVLIHFTK